MMHLTSPGIWERLIIAFTLTWHKLRALFCKGKLINIYLLRFPPLKSHSVTQKTYAVPRNLTREETMTLIRCSKANKCTVHGALTAATYLAMSQILDQNGNNSKIPLLTSFTINIRRECKPGVENEEFGLYCSFSPLQMKVNSAKRGKEHFWQFARSCTWSSSPYELRKAPRCFEIFSVRQHTISFGSVALRNAPWPSGRIVPLNQRWALVYRFKERSP